MVWRQAWERLALVPSGRRRDCHLSSSCLRGMRSAFCLVDQGGASIPGSGNNGYKGAEAGKSDIVCAIPQDLLFHLPSSVGFQSCYRLWGFSAFFSYFSQLRLHTAFVPAHLASQLPVPVSQKRTAARFIPPLSFSNRITLDP